MQRIQVWDLMSFILELLFTLPHNQASPPGDGAQPSQHVRPRRSKNGSSKKSGGSQISSVIRSKFGVEPLLLHLKKSQMMWLGHLVRMPPGCLPSEVFRAHPSGRRPPGRLSKHLRIPIEELDEVAVEKEVWASLIRLLQLWPDPGWAVENGWIDGWKVK